MEIVWTWLPANTIASKHLLHLSSSLVRKAEKIKSETEKLEKLM